MNYTGSRESGRELIVKELSQHLPKVIEENARNLQLMKQQCQQLDCELWWLPCH
jgi:hypothetical protein